VAKKVHLENVNEVKVKCVAVIKKHLKLQENSLKEPKEGSN